MTILDETTPLQREQNPFTVVLLLLFACMLGTLFGSVLAYGWVAAQGLNFQTLLSDFNEKSPLLERNAVRMANLLNHFAAFTLPAILVGFFLYRKRWIAYFKLDRLPNGVTIFAGILFVIVSFPFIQIIYWLNRQLPLPALATEMEKATEGMLKGLLVMDSPYELLFNLLVVAILPAIGEELVFRGVLQQQLEKIFRRPILAIWVTAIIFSAIHLQFAGFLPRLVLGASLGYVFYWTRSLWVAILAHFFTNGLQVIAQYATGGELIKEDTLELDVADWLLGISSLLAVIGIGYYLWKKHGMSKNEQQMSADSNC